MRNYRLKWTGDGRERTSVVAYDERSAEQRKQELEAAGATEVRVVEVPIFEKRGKS
ncbi:hypothetical protein ABT115_08785 [Streptomyces sp. NPDC001832]|uniref:hypothetical protein n=1 Tax=Streptomyces sp. NPDC001832 TaxID=3154527 RepID=UPI00331D25D1